MSALALETIATDTCPSCGASVIVGKRGPSRILLEPTPRRQGLYAIGPHGRLERRPLVDIYAERSAAIFGGGYDEHDCATEEGVDLRWDQK